MSYARSKFRRLVLISTALLIPVLVAGAYALVGSTQADTVASESAQWRASLILVLVALMAVAGTLIACWRWAFLPLRDISARRDRLESLYAFSNFLADASPEALAAGISIRVRDLLQADAMALRFCGNGETAFEVVTRSTSDLSAAAVQCLADGAQALTSSMSDAQVQRVMLDNRMPEALRACRGAGMQCLIYVPVRTQRGLLAEMVLYYSREVWLDEAREGLISTLVQHLIVTLENQRTRALDRGEAVSAERHFIARELHDSIAQSLGFLKIQIHLLRKAIDKQDQAMAAFALAELDAGLANSIADVRELLLHFRTRTESGDIDTAIQETLQKFQNQSGLKAYFESSGEASQLASDVQIQVLNILQESLSNIRKHAKASRVDIRLVRGQTWCLVVNDDGRGFDTDADGLIFSVGLKIMRERAEMIGATLVVNSVPGSGTTVTLKVPLTSAVRPSLSGKPAGTDLAAAAHALPDQTRELATSKT